MKIKVKKYIFESMVNIFIEGFDCTEINIFKIINVFNFKNILAIIDSEDELTSFLSIIKQQGIKYTTAFNTNKVPNTNVILLSEPGGLKQIITDVFKYNPEFIFLANVNDQSQWDQYLYNSKFFQNGKLIKYNYSDLCVAVAIDKFDICITLNTQAYNVSLIVTQIKELFKV